MYLFNNRKYWGMDAHWIQDRATLGINIVYLLLFFSNYNDIKQGVSGLDPTTSFAIGSPLVNCHGLLGPWLSYE